MSDASVSKRLQKTIVVYSALGMFAVGVVVGLVGVLPLAQRLREAQRRNLLVDLQKQTFAVEQLVSRARNSGAAMAARSRIREKMEAYYNGTLTFRQLAAATDQVLHETSPFATNTAGVTLFDARSNLVARSGHVIPPELMPWPNPASTEVSMRGPLRLGDETVLILSATMMSTNPPPNNVRLGTVMTLYRTRAMQSVIEDYENMGKTGETILGSRRNKHLPIFFPLRYAKSGFAPNPRRIATIME